jgi:hypothetical protein
MYKVFLTTLAICSTGYADLNLYQINATSAGRSRQILAANLVMKWTNTQETVVRIPTPDVRNTEYDVAFKRLRAFALPGPNEGMIFLVYKSYIRHEHLPTWLNRGL